MSLTEEINNQCIEAFRIGFYCGILFVGLVSCISYSVDWLISKTYFLSGDKKYKKIVIID
jgi:hypothetical protein